MNEDKLVHPAKELSPTTTLPLPTKLTFVKDVRFLKASVPKVTSCPIVRETKRVPAKTSAPTLTPLGSTKSVIDVPLNALSPISFKVVGSTISEIEVFLKAFFPIVNNPSGSLTLVKSATFSKALFPIVYKVRTLLKSIEVKPLIALKAPEEIVSSPGNSVAKSNEVILLFGATK